MISFQCAGISSTLEADHIGKNMKGGDKMKKIDRAMERLMVIARTADYLESERIKWSNPERMDKDAVEVANIRDIAIDEIIAALETLI